jgi:hypothetical protein
MPVKKSKGGGFTHVLSAPSLPLKTSLTFMLFVVKLIIF